MEIALSPAPRVPIGAPALADYPPLLTASGRPWAASGQLNVITPRATAARQSAAGSLR